MVPATVCVRACTWSPSFTGGEEESKGQVPSDAIVLHEDKQYYPDASEVYPEAETMVQDEDTQMLDEPIIAPIKTRLFSVLEKGGPPDTTYSTEYMVALMDNPSLIRNVALAGHLAHGACGWGAVVGGLVVP